MFPAWSACRPAAWLLLASIGSISAKPATAADPPPDAGGAPYERIVLDDQPVAYWRFSAAPQSPTADTPAAPDTASTPDLAAAAGLPAV
ncbi:MAG: hypothetical protein J5I93_16125, partial [Pirellulaceae bacterium]|nr:hypothetical protein [Pirellulaceae bacterium]